MDYHNIHGGREECSSSESGWTMYIASPDDNEYSNVEDGDDHLAERNGGEDVDDRAEDIESDDSMISDASSGPSHLYPGTEGSHGGSKNAEQKTNRKSTGKKQQRQGGQKKPSNQDRKAGKEQPVSKLNSNPKCSKFRKNK